MARQIERAWRQHDPAQARVPYEVKCRVEAFKRALIAPTEAVVQQVAMPDRLLSDCIKRRGVARQRALAAVRGALQEAIVTGSKDMIEVRWLAPGKHLIVDAQNPGELQDSTCVCIALLWREPWGAVTYWANFLLECSDHAAARFLQRAPHADLHAALYEAARNFTAADAQDVWQCLANGQTIYLASGPAHSPAT